MQYLSSLASFLLSIMGSSVPVDQLVTVQVPRHLLTAVYAFIAEHDGKAAPPDVVEESPPHTDTELPRISWQGWTVADFESLVRDRRPSALRIVKVLDVLAADPDTEFPATQLAEATGLTRGELSGGFSGFTRICKTLRSDARLDWPIQWTHGPSARDDQVSETSYYLPAVLAERWIQARAR